MTQQASDTILYEASQCPLRERPLEAFARAKELSQKFVRMSTDNVRGHIALWTIKDGWLQLTEIDGLIKTDSEPRAAVLSDVLPDCTGPLVATWFTGTLTLGVGNRIGSEYEYGPDIYERTVLLTFDAGHLETTTVIANSQGRPDSFCPERAWFPMSQDGHNAYMDAWTAWHRTKPQVSGIAIAAIQDHRAAVALASANGWKDVEA